MNVDMQAHFLSGEMQKSLDSSKDKVQHVSTIKIDENENELEASKSLIKSDIDQQYQSGVSSRLEDMANMPSMEHSKEKITVETGADG